MRVVIVPGHESSWRVLERLTAWSRSGLLEPFCWWVVPLEFGGEPTEPNTLVQLIHEGEGRLILLGDALEGTEPEDVALMGFYPATPSEGFEEWFGDALDPFVAAAANVFPFQPMNPAEACAVVAPATIGQPVPSGIFSLRRSANLYVAPEDRADPRDANRLVDNPGRFPSHAAHAVATIGDLWKASRGRDKRALDELALRQRHGGDVARVEVVRCYSRAIEYGYLADHVSAGVFRERDRWPNPDGERFVRIKDPSRGMPQVVKRFMDKHKAVLGLSEFDPVTLPPKKQPTLWEALKILIREFVWRVKRRPRQLFEEGIAYIHNAAADKVLKMASSDSSLRETGIKKMTAGPEVVEYGLPNLYEHLAYVPLHVSRGPVIETWHDLQSLSLGLVDGSSLPKGFDQLLMSENKRVLVTEPGQVVPDPESPPPPVIERTDPRPCNPRELDPSMLPAPLPIDAPPDEQAAGFTEADRAELAAWSAPHEQTPLWMIGLRVASNLRTAEHEAAATVEHADPTAAQAREQERAVERSANRRGFRRTLLWMLGAIVVLAGVAWGALPPLAAAPASVALVVLWLLVIAGAWRKVMQADDAMDRDDVERELRILNQAMRRAQRQGDRERLARRYEEYLDWAEILGWIVHKPWVGTPLDAIELPPPVDRETLPAAFSVGVGNVTPEALKRLCSQADTKLFSTAWLASLHLRVRNSAMDEILLDQEYLDPAQAAVRRPDPAEPSEDLDSPLRRFLEAVRRGDNRSLHDNPLTQDLLGALANAPLDSVSGGVAVVPPGTIEAGIDPLPPSAAWLEAPSDFDELAESLRPTVVRLDVRTPGGRVAGGGVVIDREGRIVTARHVIEGATDVAVVLADGNRLAATVESLADDTDLALLSIEAEDPMRPAALAHEGAGLAAGRPVVAVGYADLLDRSPQVTWGLVTSAERWVEPGARLPELTAIRVLQATYRGRAGAPGSGVFGLDGRLIGVQCAGSFGGGQGQAGNLRSAVPVARLHALLAGAESVDAPAEVAGGSGANEALPFARPGLADASDFMAELRREGDDVALLPRHWRSPNGAHVVSGTIPASVRTVDAHEALARLSGGVAYLKPLRVLIHRIDLTRPVQADDLSSCTEG
jgi:putative serine protease PepD